MSCQRPASAKVHFAVPVSRRAVRGSSPPFSSVVEGYRERSRLKCPRTASTNAITRLLEMSYEFLDDARSPIMSTGTKQIFLDPIGRQRTCVGSGMPRARGIPADDAWREPFWMMCRASVPTSSSISWPTQCATPTAGLTTGRPICRDGEMMQVWADYLDLLKSGKQVGTNTTASDASHTSMSSDDHTHRLS